MEGPSGSMLQVTPVITSPVTGVTPDVFVRTMVRVLPVTVKTAVPETALPDSGTCPLPVKVIAAIACPARSANPITNGAIRTTERHSIINSIKVENPRFPKR